MLKLNLSKLLHTDKKAYRQKVLKRLCDEINYAAITSKNGKAPCRFYKKILAEIKDEEPWVNRNLICFAYKKYCQRKKFESKEAASKASATRQGGRTKGSTNIKKHYLKKVLLAAKNEIATIYLCEKKGGIAVTKWLVEQQNCRD